MTRTLRQTGLPFILCVLLAAILTAEASAFEVKIGPVREQTLKWLMESRGLSRAAAEQEMRRAARENRADVIDSFELPDGALADFVTVDSRRGKPTLTHEGCAKLFSPYSDYGRRFWAEIEKKRGTPGYDNFMRVFQEAVERGFFIQKLSPEQEERLKNAAQGKRDSVAAIQEERVLIVSAHVPNWNDQSTAVNAPHLHYVPASPVKRGHPLNLTWNDIPNYRGEAGLSPGGRWTGGSPTGLDNPSWDNSGTFTALGTGHPEIQKVRPIRTDFIEYWYTFFFDLTNPNSVANWWRANSHGNVQITGDRSNIVAWLDSFHPTDALAIGGVEGHDYLPMPGTPVIRDSATINPGGNPIIRASLNGTSFSILYNTHGMGGGRDQRGSYTFTFPTWPQPAAGPLTTTTFRIKAGTGSVTVDPYDDRHVTFSEFTFEYNDPNDTTPPTEADASGGPPTGSPWSVTTPAGVWDAADAGYMPAGQGCGALTNTLVTEDEVIGDLPYKNRAGHRMFSLCYYTHDHIPGSLDVVDGQFFSVMPAGQPYQLRHPRTNGFPDPIMGATDDAQDHYDRPAPYDHSSYDDQNYYTGGYFHFPGAVGSHDTGTFGAHMNQILADEGVAIGGYNRIVYTWPAGANLTDAFIPMGGGAIYVPENCGLGLMGHESGHAIGGFVDLYDTDFYWNMGRKLPPHFESDAMGPYSIMSQGGGMRVDAWHKIASGYADPVWLSTTGDGTGAPQNKLVAPIPEIEGNLQNPIIYKALPDLWALPPVGPITGNLEYFLIENRNRNGGNYFGDPSPNGMYIYHIDERFGQDDDRHFMVIVEQADGLNELENQGPGWSVARPDAMNGDPFPGSFNIRTFYQLGTIDGNGVKKASPNTNSHGVVVGGALQATTAYDTFFRADQISDPGANMTADLYVQPHELIVTAKDVAPATAEQGELAVPVLGLHLKNSNVAPDISTGDVVIREILIDESGSSKADTDVDRVVVYEDVNKNGVVNQGTDVLLATGTMQNQQANITGMSYRVPANRTPPAERDLLICYDVATAAKPGKTLGAGIDYADPNIDPNFPRSAITCQIPGVVQQRVRILAAAPGNLGNARFPIRTDDTKTVIVEAPDTLTITPTNLAPAKAIQGTDNVPMLGLRLRVDQDEVIVDALKIDMTTTPVRAGDVAPDLYIDQNINGIIDPADTVLDSATFSMIAGKPVAVFDDLKNYTVVEGTDRGLIVAFDVADDARGGDFVHVRVGNPPYVTLRQPPSPSPQDVVAKTNFLPWPTGIQSTSTEIVVNTEPTLVDHLGTLVDWVIPQDGRPTTLFRWEATYTDAENQAPAFLRVVLNGTAYNMTPVNPGDTDYTDGALYRYETNLPVGSHVYYMRCSDGKTVLRFPTTAPDTFPHPVVTNPPPTLTMAPGETDWWSPKQTLPPHDGTPRTTFTWRVIYTDVENEAPNPLELWLDGAAYAMTPANPADTDYTDGAEFTYATTLPVGLHSYYLVSGDGTNNVRIPTAAPNTLTGPDVFDPPCTLTDTKGGTVQWLFPKTGTPQTLFTWNVIYADSESVPPTSLDVWIDGVAFPMTQVNPADQDYTDGALFRYQTTLPKGNHAYFVQGDDGNNVVRFPTTPPATYPFPVVTDDPCALVDKLGTTTEWVTPQDGSPLTNFVWQATYSDPENQPPASLLVHLDGAAQPMVQVNPADQDYTDGAVFQYQTQLPVGNHTYYISVTDGSNPLRFPATTAPPNNVYPHPVVTDPPCTLTDKNGGTSAWLNLKNGDTFTNFIWRAIYTDPEGVAPVTMQLWLDGVAINMAQADPTDQDYTDGAEFRYQTKLPVGTHSYYLLADDGNNQVRFPATGAYPFPVVTDPPLILTDSAGGTTAWLAPTTGTPPNWFRWEAIYTDPQNDPPTAIQVVLDGVAQNMTPVNPADTDYTNGALFRYRVRWLSVGTHSFYMFASDGSASRRYPTTAPDTYPQPVVNNTPPTLANAAVNPAAGTEATAFTYSITYTDVDRHLPTQMQIQIDGGGWIDMVISAAETTPADPTDGNVYEYQSGLIGAGAHKARFRASDGFDTVFFPASGPFTGPVILTQSNAFWADNAFAPFAGPYEEGDQVFIVVEDADRNADVTAKDSLDVTVTVLTGGDTETVSLQETTTTSGIFRGKAPTLGRAGAAGDGTINVIAGPGGNQLRMDYADPNDPTDTQQLTIGVTDTVAPRIVWLSELLAAPNADGTVVNIDFTAYDEAGQIDVAGYDVYFEPTSGNPIGGLTPVASLPAGTRTVSVPTTAPDGPHFVAVVVRDEVPNGRTDVKWRQVSTADTNPPVLQGESPADGTTDVPLNTNILFQIVDPGSGVLEQDIRVRIQQDPADGGGWTDVTAGLVFQGTDQARTVTYDPPVDFLYNQRVTVEVTATDQFGNVLQDTFSFFVTTDGAAPQLQNADPANGDTNVPVNTDISFELTDDLSGIDPASVHVTVNGTDVTAGLQLGGTPTLTTVLYDPPADFDWGATVTVTVDASDVAGNAMSTVLYSFTILPDAEGTTIDQLSPADGATAVPIGTDIAFRVLDNVSGVDKASVQLFIADVQVPLTDANFKQLSPTALLVTYDPPTDFAFSTNVKVKASARDLAANPRTTATWRFTTEGPPTFSITGTIEETIDTGSALAKVGVAGVTVNILDAATSAVVKTVKTVGTGVFEVTGLLEGSYVVEPTLTDYSFASVKTGKPTQRVYVGLQDNDGDGNPELDASGVDFDATRTLYSIRGRVLEGGVGLSGVTVTDGTRTAVTDAQGKYRIDDVPSGIYNVSASRTNYTFNPVSRRVVVASANATDVDFTAAAVTFSITGTIEDASGDRLAGVKVEVEGGTSVAVTNQAGQYTLTGVKAGLRTILVSRDGYVFEPAPGVDATDLNVDGDMSGIDFIGYPVLDRSFAAGTHFIGVPVLPRDDDAQTVFGSRDVARWLGLASPPQYVTVRSNPAHEALDVMPGRGFFVRYGQPTQVQVAGTPVPTSDPYVFVVDKGWYMAANPFAAALGFGNFSPSAADSLAPYGFVLEGNRYALVSDIAALGGRSWVNAWEGIWLLSDVQGLSITALPPGSGPAAAGDAAAWAPDRNNWRIPIVAQAAGTVDSVSVVGVSAATGALSVANPPTLPDTVDVIVRDANGRGLACDIQPTAAAAGITWQFAVATTMPNADVQLSLPDLSEVPEDLTVTLVDVAAGKSVYARTMPTYVYNSGQGGDREFRLEVKPRGSAGLTLRPAGAQVRGAVASIGYVLSTDAEVSARVLNVGGRLVRSLPQGAAAAGTNTLTWDLTSDTQTRVPTGRYLVQIEAVAPDGQRATVMQSLLVDR